MFPPGMGFEQQIELNYDGNRKDHTDMSGLILLASYPKSGNTWFRALLGSILDKGQDIDINSIGVPHCADRASFDRVLGMNSSDLTAREVSRIRPQVYEFAVRMGSGGDLSLKVHDAWLPFPGSVTPFPRALIKRVIYIMRDPRDVAVSYANHLGRPVESVISYMNLNNFTIGQDRTMLRPQLPQLISTWSNHVRSWTNDNKLDVHVMKYEQMLSDPLREFRVSLDFLELRVTDSVLIKAIEATRFDKLRLQEEKNGFGERSPYSKSFFRRGVANGWQDTLTRMQTDRIVVDHSEVMRQFGYLE